MKRECTCDLCGLDVGISPFYLDSGGKRLQFCCKGCLGIYQMLHEHELSAKPATPASPDDTQSSKGEMS